jgi:hypothetical protein
MFWRSQGVAPVLEETGCSSCSGEVREGLRFWKSQIAAPYLEESGCSS